MRPATYNTNPGGSNRRSSSRRIEAARKRVNHRPSSSLAPPYGGRVQNHHDDGPKKRAPTKATEGQTLLKGSRKGEGTNGKGRRRRNSNKTTTNHQQTRGQVDRIGKIQRRETEAAGSKPEESPSNSVETTNAIGRRKGRLRDISESDAGIIWQGQPTRSRVGAKIIHLPRQRLQPRLVHVARYPGRTREASEGLQI